MIRFTNDWTAPDGTKYKDGMTRNLPATVEGAAVAERVAGYVPEASASPERARVNPVTQAILSAGGSMVDTRQRRRSCVARIAGLTNAGVAASVITRCLKVEAEGPFSRVRFRLYSEGGAGTVFRIAAAATETMGLAAAGALTLAEVISQPVVSGVSYPAVRASVGSPGWVRVPVAGADPFDWPGAGANDLPKELVTDWVDIRSVARADVPGGRPALLFRMEHDGGANGNWSSIPVQTWRAAAGAYPWFRDYQAATIATADGVTDLTKTINFLATSTTWVGVEFDYDAPAHTVMLISDSQGENMGTYAVGDYGTWLYQACATVSSPQRPVVLFNAGRAGGASSLYAANGLAEIARVAPSVIFYQPCTSNDPLTAASREAQLSRLANVMNAGAAVGARVVAFTGIPFSAGTAPTAQMDAFRLDVANHCRTLAASGLLIHVDFEDILGVGSSPNRPNANLFGADGIHIAPGGAEAISPRVVSALRYALGG